MLRDEHPPPSQSPVFCHLARQPLSYNFLLSSNSLAHRIPLAICTMQMNTLPIKAFSLPSMTTVRHESVMGIVMNGMWLHTRPWCCMPDDERRASDPPFSGSDICVFCLVLDE